MTDLTPITALNASEPRSATFGAVNLRENADLGLASLALRKGQTAPQPFGLTLPTAGKAVTGAEVAAFWIGREQWMIEAPGKGEADFAAAVRGEAPGCSVTEQTDGFAAIEITSDAGGAPIEMLLSKLGNVDPKAFNPGSAVRTNLEHMGVFLIRRGEDHLSVIGMRTFAQALWHALTTSAKRLES